MVREQGEASIPKHPCSGTHQSKRRARSITNSTRVLHGISSFITLPPSESQNAIFLRCTRLRQSDPFVMHHPELARWYGRLQPSFVMPRRQLFCRWTLDAILRTHGETSAPFVDKCLKHSFVHMPQCQTTLSTQIQSESVCEIGMKFCFEQRGSRRTTIQCWRYAMGRIRKMPWSERKFTHAKYMEGLTINH